MHPALKRLSEIEQAATKGPWEKQYSFNLRSPDPRGGTMCPLSNSGMDVEQREANFTFVAAARNALPALIASLVEIEELIEKDHYRHCDGMYPAGYSRALREVQAIIHRHLEPLK